MLKRHDRTTSPSTPDSGGASPVRWADLAIVVGLGGAVLLAYFNVIHGTLVRDDQFVIAEDPRLRAFSWENLKLIIEHTYWWPSFPTKAYRPFSTLTYLLNWSVFGNQNRPEGYHAFNLLL